ncbi:MAG: SDR family oxidoreductase [Proteobacteria bacterium]|nr:SDR family oxidoreductase [Pseudomonadota bacterium]
MLTGKRALVTGSTRGLGQAIARALAGEGCDVMLNGFGDAADIEGDRAALEAETGVRVRYHGGDLATEEGADALADAAMAAFGSVDILVNNAVIRHFHAAEDFPRAEWRKALAVNLSAPFYLIQRVLPGMRAGGWGRIVNIASVMGLAARAGRADYITAKTGLIGLTRAIAAETRLDANVTCNAICPGSVLTPNTEIKIAEFIAESGLPREEAVAEFLRMRGQAMGFIQPERVAKLAVFLCQDSSFDMTGAVMPIDQGRSATWLEQD